jgi:hypothetical protein
MHLSIERCEVASAALGQPPFHQVPHLVGLLESLQNYIQYMGYLRR